MPPSNLVRVPHDALSLEALDRVIAEFVTRAGTDYGAEEKAIEKKIADVKRQLAAGEAVIVFDTDAQTANIVSARELSARAMRKPNGNGEQE